MSPAHRPGRARPRDFADLQAPAGWPATCSMKVAMTLHLPMLRLLFAVLMASPAAAARRTHKSAVHDSPDEAADCLRLASKDEVLAGTLLSGSLGNDREFASVRFTGARSFTDDALWDLVGGQPGFPLSRDKATALVARLAQSGLFSSVEPRSVAREEAEIPALEIDLVENARLNAVEVRGLSEFRTEDIVERLLDAPSSREVDRRLRELRDARPGECPAPLPPRAWLPRGHNDAGGARGIWQGLPAALRRAMSYLRTRGYPLASLQGELTPFGDLV